MRFVDHELLLDGSSRDVAEHLRAAAKRHGATNVNSDLLDAIEIELIPPSIMSIWLTAAHDQTPDGGASVTTAALLQHHSAFTRIFAIKNTGRLLRTNKWRVLWDALSGTAGWLNLFGNLSVRDVKRLSAQIGHSYKFQDQAKTKCVTELFYCLMSPYFPDAILQHEDTRPLQAHYMAMLPACSDECVTKIMTGEVFSRHTRISRPLMCSHGHLLQKFMLESPSGIKLRVVRPNWLWSQLPVLKGSEHGMSPSMTFALSILRQASSTSQASLANFDTLALVNSLTSRAVKRCSPQLSEILELGVSYYLNEPRLASKLSFSHEGFFFDVVRAWGGRHYRQVKPQSRRPDYTDVLSKMIRLTRPTRSSVVSYDELMKIVDLAHRYQLLRLLILGHDKIDIDDDAQLRAWKRGQLSTTTVELLGSRMGIAFIDRLARVHPKGDFLPASASKTSGGFFSEPLAYDAEYTDHKLLLTALHQGNETGAQLALTGVREQKKLAMSSRDQQQRVFHARLTLKYAAASRSLSLFADTLIWAKRYLKDPLTAQELYGSKMFNGSEIAALLSGLQPLGSDDVSSLDVQSAQTNVELANTIMEDLIQTALEAKREPHYQETHWDFVKTFFRAVIKERVKRSLLLEKSSVPSEVINNAILSVTLDHIVKVERQGLQHGFQPLWVNERHRSHTNHRDAHGLKSSNVRVFYDRLAEARDNLWRQHRLTSHPSCAELPLPFPRGLPIQCLTLEGEVLYGVTSTDMPFLTKRVEDIVFMLAEDAVMAPPEQDDIRDAIRGYVDAFDTALDLFVLQDSGKSEKLERVNRVRSHWIKALQTQSQMSAGEIHKYVETIVLKSKVIPDSLLAAREVDVNIWPRRPTAADATQNPEWDPYMHKPQVPKNRKVPVTALDCFTRLSEIWNFDPQEKLVLPPEWSTMWYQNESFDTAALSSIGTTAEGVILSRILLLDSQRKGGTRLLTTSFPTLERVRYPAVYLDSQFLEKQANRRDRMSASLLQRLITRVPPRLLRSLAKSYLDSLNGSLDSADVARAEAVAYNLLALLGQSDKPEIAHELIIKTVLDRPEASSWHRRLLACLSSKTVPKATVEIAVSRYADEVIARLSNWSTQATSASDYEHAPSMKISTIKQLPQMFQNATSLPPAAAVDVLRSIVEKCDHYDVRVEVVNALLQILLLDDHQLPQSLFESVLATLEVFVPIIGSFDERRPLSEQQWIEHEASLTVPAPYDENQPCPPLLGSFLLTRFPKRVKQELFKRVLLPAMEKSKRENLRVIKLILRKHSQRSETVENTIPFRFQVLDLLIGMYHQHMPRSYFDDYCALVMENMRRSMHIQLFTAKLKNDIDLAGSDEERIWSSFYDIDRQVLGRSFSMHELLQHDWNSKASLDSELSLEMVREVQVKQAHTLIESLEGVLGTEWTSFIYNFRPPGLLRYPQHTLSNQKRHVKRVQEDGMAKFIQRPDPDPEVTSRTVLVGYGIWTVNTRPILQAIIQQIDTLRQNRSWGKTASGGIRILPSTLDLRIWLLPVPVVPDEPALSVDLERYARALLNFMVKGIAADTCAFHEAMREIISQANTILSDRHTDVLCHVGIMAAEILEQEGRSTRAGLFVEFVIHSIADSVLGWDSRFQKNSIPYYRNEQARTLLFRLIDKWKASENESLWAYAVKIEDETKDAAHFRDREKDWVMARLLGLEPSEAGSLYPDLLEM